MPGMVLMALVCGARLDAVQMGVKGDSRCKDSEERDSSMLRRRRIGEWDTD
jgi:hypothetical protein